MKRILQKIKKVLSVKLETFLITFSYLKLPFLLHSRMSYIFFRNILIYKFHKLLASEDCAQGSLATAYSNNRKKRRKLNAAVSENSPEFVSGVALVH